MTTDLTQAVWATGGPFFAAYWKYPGSSEWSEERFRMFRLAKARLMEEKDCGAVMGYVSHIVTDEAVYSFGAIGETEQNKDATEYEEAAAKRREKRRECLFNCKSEGPPGPIWCTQCGHDPKCCNCDD